MELTSLYCISIQYVLLRLTTSEIDCLYIQSRDDEEKKKEENQSITREFTFNGWMSLER